jgi:hypothetical protein
MVRLRHCFHNILEITLHCKHVGLEGGELPSIELPTSFHGMLRRILVRLVSLRVANTHQLNLRPVSNNKETLSVDRIDLWVSPSVCIDL